MSLLLTIILAQSLTPTTVRQNITTDGGVVPWVVIPSAVNNPTVGVFGAQKVVQETPLESLTFQYSINTEFVNTVTADGGTVTQANSSAVMTTGTNDGGYAAIVSRRTTRYVPGQGIRLRFTAVFSTCKADSRQEVGLGNDDDDFIGFGCVGASFGVIHRRAGSQTFVASTAWNGQRISFDITKGNVYQLSYQWLGYGIMRLEVQKPSGEPTIVHTFQFPNTRTTPTFSNPALKFMARAYNSGNVTSLVLSVPSVGIVQEGVQTENNGIHRGLLNRRSVTTTAIPVIALRNNSEWAGGVANMVRLRLQDIHVSGTGAGDINCFLVENAGHTVLAWTDISATNSPASYMTDGGNWDAGGIIRHAWVLEGNAGGTSFDLGDILIDPGNYLSVICYTTTGTSTTGAAINWIEEF